MRVTKDQKHKFATKLLGSITLMNPPPRKQGAMHQRNASTIKTLLKRAKKEGCNEVRVDDGRIGRIERRHF